MSKFVYTLKDDKGRDYEGSIEAKDKREAQAALDTKGYYLTSLREVPQLQLSIMPKKVTRKDAIVFAQQMGTMLGTGLPILKSLSAIAEQSDNEMMRTVINDIRAKIEAGFKLSDAMDKYPNVFSPFFVSLVRTGEASGAMDEAFKTLSSYMEREEEIKRKVKSAFAYPIIVGVILLCVVTFLLMNVVPRFQDFYDSMKVELPGPTVMLLAASHFIREQWLIAILGTVGMVVGFILFKKTPQGGYILDKIKMNLPLLGILNRKTAITRFIRSFGALISSGIPITQALEVAQSIAGNAVIMESIEGVRAAVIRGESISSSLRYSRVFPPIVIQMIAAGEESGAMDEMLAKSADFLDQDIDSLVKSIMVKLEPLLTVTMAAVIGFIAVAIYLPMFDLIRRMS